MYVLYCLELKVTYEYFKIRFAIELINKYADDENTTVFDPLLNEEYQQIF